MQLTLPVFRSDAGGGNGLVVDAALHLATDSADLFQKARRVAHDAQLAALIMVPTHGYLFQAKLREISDVQVFHIEAEAFDGRGFDDRAADVHTKCLEAALRIPEWKPRRQAHDEIDNAPSLLAPPGLMHADQTSVE